MEKRSLFSKIFGEKKKEYKVLNKFELLNNFNSNFYTWNGTIYDNNIIRSAIWTNASNAGKLNPKHIRKDNEKIEVMPNRNIKKILQTPNQYMTMFDFVAKMMIQRDVNNNAFAYIDRDENVFGMNGIKGIYPISSSSVELLQDEEENLFVKFRFKKGNYITVPYEDVIHIRKHFNENDFWGESNSKAIEPILETINTTNQGIQKAIKNTAFIRGILEFVQVLKPEDEQKNVKEFSKRYLDINNNEDGLAYTDPRYKFHELKNEPFVPNKAQMDYAKQELFDYFNINEKIIQGIFSEQEWIAYFETNIQPFSVQMSQEFTNKIFTNTEKGYGNEIVFEANKLANASNATKITICEKLGHLFTINEQREIWNRAPVPGGDVRLQSLNFVNADKADEYQLGEEEEKKNE